MNLRRKLLLALGAGTLLPEPVGVWPRAAFAQKPGRNYRIGWLKISSTRAEPYDIAFTKRLAERGFIEGRNLEIVFRNAEGFADIRRRLTHVEHSILGLKRDEVDAATEITEHRQTLDKLHSIIEQLRERLNTLEARAAH